MKHIKEYEICLSIQRALLDKVTPALRRISFSVNEENIILFFYYDGPLTENEKELVGDVAVEVISDFPEHDIDCKVEEIIFPKKINSLGQIIYNRYE